MKSRNIILLGVLSGFSGAVIASLIFFGMQSASAEVTSSGYTVCGNKITNALRMASSSKPCAKTEFKYFFLTEVVQVNEPIYKEPIYNAPRRASISYLTGGSFCDSGYSNLRSVDVITSVSWNSYDKYNPISSSSSRLKSCTMDVLVP